MVPELPDFEGVVGEVEVNGELLLAALAQRVLGQVGAAVEPELEMGLIRSNVITRYESTPSKDMSGALRDLAHHITGSRHS